MRSRRMITVVGCHAGGEIGNVIVGGVLPPRGATVFEQMQELQRDGRLAPAACCSASRAGAWPPTRTSSCPRRGRTATRGSSSWSRPSIRRCPDRTRSAPPPSCSRRGWSRCASRRRSSGWKRPVASSRCAPTCRDGRCESVEFTNVPCFADRLDAPLEVEGLGTLTVDVAYGGMWYAIADAQALGFEIEPHEARDLSLAGEAIRAAAREQLPCAHPENPAIAGVSIVQIAAPWQGVGAVTKNAVVVAPGRLDRSATGTGLSARMAVLHARGLMAVGDGMTHASAIGSTFDGRIVEETQRRRPGCDRPGDPGQRLDHRHLTAFPRPDRSLSGGLPARRHVGRQRPRRSGLTARRTGASCAGLMLPPLTTSATRLPCR